ncbi:uncharacterized protein [Onthophagus taurus]|uniref:uncharacterized protein isoform X1 n=1 Tax=Onthophagus taurus TaxID=166361 RepID=UPI0039BE5C12
MSFVVTPPQHPLCNCNYHESYDFNTLRRQWSELSKNFPYNKKMTGVFGLALFDACNENAHNYQCKCKELYHQFTSDGCNGGKMCTCKACKVVGGCDICTHSADINNQKRLISETMCYTCPCGIASPNRLAYGCREADYTHDGTKLNNKRDKDIKHLKHLEKDGNITSESPSSVRRNSSPTRFCDGSISQVLGFKGNDPIYNLDEHLGTVYTKPMNMRSSIPATPASSSPTSLRGCLRDRRCSACGCSKCSPCSTYVPCSTCTSCNTCGYRPCNGCTPCGKCPTYHGNGMCPPCVPCQRLNIADRIQKISEHNDESLAESVIEAIPEIVPVKTPKHHDTPKHHEPQKHHDTSSEHHDTHRHHDTSSERHETSSEHYETKHKIVANPVEKIINNPSDKTSTKTVSKASDRHSNKVSEKIEKFSLDNEIYDRQSSSSVKSYDAISSKSEQDSTRSNHHHHKCTCKCMRTLCSLFTFLIILASIFLMWSYTHQTWPFKPKCSYRYHLYAPIKPYKR